MTRIISNRIETNQITGSTATFNTVNFYSLSGSTATIHNLSASTIDVNDFQSNRIISNDIRTTSSTTQAYGQFLNTFTQHGNSNQNTYFGLSLAMKDANTVYVGAYDDSIPGASRHGSVYKFDYTPGSTDSDGSPWVQDTNFRLTASDFNMGLESPTSTEYGKSIAAEGNYIAVGAPRATQGGRSNSGKVYIIREDPDAEMRGDGNAFKTEKVLTVSASSGDEFGKVLAMSNSGKSLAIGAPNSGSSDIGRVFVYRSGTIADDWRLSF